MYCWVRINHHSNLDVVRVSWNWPMGRWLPYRASNFQEETLPILEELMVVVVFLLYRHRWMIQWKVEVKGGMWASESSLTKRGRLDDILVWVSDAQSSRIVHCTDFLASAWSIEMFDVRKLGIDCICSQNLLLLIACYRVTVVLLWFISALWHAQ